MSATTVISTVDNITLVTLQEFPANVASIAKVLEDGSMDAFIAEAQEQSAQALEG